MAIPKVIHYCWFGKEKLPKTAVECINSWRKFCPDYKIIQWDESNYDINKNKYMAQAYEAKKWAFVSDFARLDIIHENGGLYFDVDVELIRPIDELLEYSAFFARETYGKVNSGLGFGAEKGNHAVENLLGEYAGISFLNEEGNCDLTPCPVRNTNALNAIGFNSDINDVQLLCDGSVAVFPEEYFCPMHVITRKLTLTDKTYSIHHFDASWQKKSNRLKNKLRTKLGPEISLKLINIKRKLVGKEPIKP